MGSDQKGAWGLLKNELGPVYLGGEVCVCVRAHALLCNFIRLHICQVSFSACALDVNKKLKIKSGVLVS